jgi:hypothetical protein
VGTHVVGTNTGLNGNTLVDTYGKPVIYGGTGTITVEGTVLGTELDARITTDVWCGTFTAELGKVDDRNQAVGTYTGCDDGKYLAGGGVNVDGLGGTGIVKTTSAGTLEGTSGDGKITIDGES